MQNNKPVLKKTPEGWANQKVLSARNTEKTVI